jgi:phosphoribosylglycinamide formyltransferase-1
MEKLIGLKKIKTAIFISGRGSNLKNLIRFSKTKISPIIIDLVIANKKAEGLKYAYQNKINKAVIKYANIKIAEKKILSLLKKKKN